MHFFCRCLWGTSFILGIASLGNVYAGTDSSSEPSRAESANLVESLETRAEAKREELRQSLDLKIQASEKAKAEFAVKMKQWEVTAAAKSAINLAMISIKNSYLKNRKKTLPPEWANSAKLYALAELEKPRTPPLRQDQLEGMAISLIHDFILAQERGIVVNEAGSTIEASYKKHRSGPLPEAWSAAARKAADAALGKPEALGLSPEAAKERAVAVMKEEILRLEKANSQDKAIRDQAWYKEQIADHRKKLDTGYTTDPSDASRQHAETIRTEEGFWLRGESTNSPQRLARAATSYYDNYDEWRRALEDRFYQSDKLVGEYRDLKKSRGSLSKEEEAVLNERERALKYLGEIRAQADALRPPPSR